MWFPFRCELVLFCHKYTVKSPHAELRGLNGRRSRKLQSHHLAYSSDELRYIQPLSIQGCFLLQGKSERSRRLRRVTMVPSDIQALLSAGAILDID